MRRSRLRERALVVALALVTTPSVSGVPPATATADATLSVSDATIVEGDGVRPILFTVSLSAPTTNDVSVAYTTVPGTATEGLVAGAGVDYLKRSGTLRFLPGQTHKLVAVRARGDTTVEATETMALQLTYVWGVTARKRSGIGTILDDDSSSGFRIGVGDVVITEGDAGTRSAAVSITLSTGAPSDMTIAIRTANESATAGRDYTEVVTTIPVSTAQRAAKALIPILPDASNEGDETFRVSIGSSVPVIRKRGTVRIRDDDGRLTPTSTTLSSGSSVTTLGETVALTARVTSATAVPTGTVEFRAGSTFLGAAMLHNGEATLTTTSGPVGERALWARYSGDGSLAISSSPTVRHTTLASTSTSTPCSGVAVAPGTDVQSVLNAHPTGATFCFAPGTYPLSTHVTPRSYQRLISSVPRGAVFTGRGVADGGIKSGGSVGVVVRGFVFREFVNTWSSWPRSAILSGRNWVIEDNEVAYNSQAGVEVSSGTILRGNALHHNGRYGFVGGPVDGLLIANNEIAHNNTGRHDPNNDGGGSKIIKSRNVVFRGNDAHDNYGQGLWTDWENVDITYENNRLTNNYGPGILHEASSTAVIRNNTFRGNGLLGAGKSLWWSADLFLNDSKNTEIYGNSIVAGVHGIALVDIARGSNAFGPLEIRNVSVHDNTITLPPGGATGMVGDRTQAFSSAGNSFVRNTYRVADATARAWMWGTTMTWWQWQAAGNDTSGTVTS